MACALARLPLRKLPASTWHQWAQCFADAALPRKLCRFEDFQIRAGAFGSVETFVKLITETLLGKIILAALQSSLVTER